MCRLAGSDTTATATRTTIVYVLSNPHVLKKLRAEIDGAAKIVSSPITDAEARTLPYLQACIRENFRIFPPFVGPNRKAVPEGGDFINGVSIPGGTTILANVWAVGRNEVFGPYPEVYRPERWLEANQEQERQMQANIDLVFSFGRTSCMGKPIALIELNKFIFEASQSPSVTGYGKS